MAMTPNNPTNETLDLDLLSTEVDFNEYLNLTPSPPTPTTVSPNSLMSEGPVPDPLPVSSGVWQLTLGLKKRKRLAAAGQTPAQGRSTAQHRHQTTRAANQAVQTFYIDPRQAQAQRQSTSQPGMAPVLVPQPPTIPQPHMMSPSQMMPQPQTTSQPQTIPPPQVTPLSPRTSQRRMMARRQRMSERQMMSQQQMMPQSQIWGPSQQSTPSLLNTPYHPFQGPANQ
ncbi:hypothetical protein F4821DRAFT_255549 [Hypoxylon rubiginosum]|uniref:Uncharacterized protein n=1 Tax=Hypoxylon rubiginosum TaxID=110542 RepID=A0ACC0DDE8_9PEZI|nr:hypothetical protein F4821DRAFT_255549 [Hypoxylon rubiginosum]